MRSIKRRFNNIAKGNPFWNSYMCFAEAIKEQKFSKQTIHRWFYKLVNKNDYDKKDKKAILAHLSGLTNSPEDNKNSS